MFDFSNRLRKQVLRAVRYTPLIYNNKFCNKWKPIVIYSYKFFILMSQRNWKHNKLQEISPCDYCNSIKNLFEQNFKQVLDQVSELEILSKSSEHQVMQMQANLRESKSEKYRLMTKLEEAERKLAEYEQRLEEQRGKVQLTCVKFDQQ